MVIFLDILIVSEHVPEADVGLIELQGIRVRNYGDRRERAFLLI